MAARDSPHTWPSFFFSLRKNQTKLKDLKHFLITYFLFFSFNAFAAFHIIIDPGHGGTDLGTSRDSFIESQIVLAIAEKTKNILAKKAKPEELKITLTRQTDSNLTLQQRVQLANDLNADLFLSLHANSSLSKQVTGFEFYFAAPQSLPPSSTSTSQNILSQNEIIEKIKNDLVQLGKQKSSLEFSKQTQEQIADQKSVIRRAPFYVIENTNMPAVLIEVGFISNRREAKKLAKPEYQSEIAILLANSILSYKEKSDKKLSVNEK
jgi:N-acetylmuramoyl-L-alanine amidase